MGILSNIFSKIFPSSHAANASSEAGAAAPGGRAAPAAPAPSAPLTGSAAPAPMKEVDVARQLDDMAAASAEKLNWKTSIVDLMKLLGLDSSLSARKELAKELNYTGDTSDSAAMNIWLHRQVMTKIAANGGKVPAELKN